MIKKILFVLILSTNIYTQDSLDFYPFHVGDVWQYYESYDNYYWTKTAVSDSLDSEGNKHIFFHEKHRDSAEWFTHEMIDTNGSVWSIEGEGIENKWLRYKFGLGVDEYFAMQPEYEFNQWYGIVIDTGKTISFGEERQFIEYIYFGSSNPETYPDGALEMGNAVLVDGIGWSYSWYEPGYPNADNLVAAIIDSIKYGTIVNINDFDNKKLPEHFMMRPPFPNPFNNSVNIEFDLRKKIFIQIEIFDIKGQLVQRIAEQEFPQGNYKLKWDAKNENGFSVSSGFYIVSVSSNTFRVSRKILLLK